MPAVTSTDPSGNPYIDGLLGNVKWATNSLTFSFPEKASFYESPYGYGEPDNNFGALNGTQRAVVRDSFDLFGSAANLNFTEIAETSSQHGDLRFAMSDEPPTAWAYLPNTAPEGGDAWFNHSRGLYDSPAKGNYAYLTFLHETGHALGLEHPHQGNVMPIDRDSLEYTVMSYRSYIGASTTSGYTNETWGYPQSLMMFDIAALQHMYGADYTTNSGNTTYSWSPTAGEMFINGVGQGAPGANRVFLTVWDGGGEDTYDFSNYATNLRVDLRPGQWTTTSSEQLAKLHFDGSKIAAGNIANALLHRGDQRSLIENAIGGTGDDVIIGNAAANALHGGPGKDNLNGSAGNDRLFGGAGNDDLRGDAGDDMLWGEDGDDLFVGGAGADVFTGGTGTDAAAYQTSNSAVEVNLRDKVAKGGDAQGDRFGSIENVIGSPFSDKITGDNANNWLYGLAGDDMLWGEDGDDFLIGGPGADVLTGGPGRDQTTYHNSDSAVRVDLVARTGRYGDAEGDRFGSIENIIGSQFNDTLIGDNAANELYGLGGNDDILGGTGNDRLDGGAGNDTLWGGDGGDLLIGRAGADRLLGGAGDDQFVYAAISDSPVTNRDEIVDFSSAEGDKINLAAIDANVHQSGDQAFTYIGDNAFSGQAGELNFRDSIASGDVDGDANADLQIIVSNVSSLTADDFIL